MPAAVLGVPLSVIAFGLVSTGAPAAADLPGIALAALVSLGVGAVLGPEAPLIAPLRLPMTSVLLATPLLGREGLTVMPW